MTAPQNNRVKHATTWGQPRRDRSPLFFRVFGRIFEVISNVCRYTTYGLCVTALILLVYAGVFARHVNAYVSDGTFACELPTFQGK